MPVHMARAHTGGLQCAMTGQDAEYNLSAASTGPPLYLYRFSWLTRMWMRAAVHSVTQHSSTWPVLFKQSSRVRGMAGMHHISG